MQKISPFLWFDGGVEEAAKHYTSIFPNSKINSSSPQSATIEIEGQTLQLFNGGPMYKPTEAFSLFVKCESQAEVDKYWNAFLAGGGRESQCGWLKDKFGLSWQIIPNKLGEYMSDKDPAKAQRVVQAMLQMKKIDVAALDKAYAG